MVKIAKQPNKCVDFLKSMPLFECVSLEGINFIIEKANVIDISKGDFIFSSGEATNRIYFIMSGMVAEFLKYGGSVDVIVKTRNAGDYIGEMAMFSQSSHPNTAVALEATTLMWISKQDFEEVAERNTSIYRHIIKELAKRLVNSGNRMINTMYLDAPARLAVTLVSITGAMEESKSKWELAITQNSLAASAGIARQTATTVLNEWKALGYIKTSRGKITITKPDEIMDIILNSEYR